MLSTKDVIQYLNQHGNVQAIEDMLIRTRKEKSMSTVPV